jgi:hypothetical protein
MASDNNNTNQKFLLIMGDFVGKYRAHAIDMLKAFLILPIVDLKFKALMFLFSMEFSSFIHI